MLVLSLSAYLNKKEDTHNYLSLAGCGERKEKELSLSGWLAEEKEEKLSFFLILGIRRKNSSWVLKCKIISELYQILRVAKFPISLSM